MSSLTGLSPNNPSKYLGANVALNTVVTRNRAPTGADYRQPETGKLYPFNTFWLVGKNPTTGSQGDLYYLSKIIANVAYWSKLATGSTDDGPILTLTGNSGGAIDPDSNGNVNILGTNGVGVVGSGNTLTASVTNWVTPTANNFTPTVYGSSTVGTIDYTTRRASYSRIGNMVFFNLNITWENFTGTGNIRIGGFPIAFGFNFQRIPFSLLVENITLPAGTFDVFLDGTDGDTYGRVLVSRDGNTTTNVSVSAVGSVACTGFYFTN